MLFSVPVASIILLMLFLLSAFFSGSETALMAVNHWKIHHMAKTDKRAKLVKEVLKNPDKLIGTLLFCNNLVNVASSAIATAVCLSVFGQKGIAYATIGMTIGLLIFAEITPKTLASYYPEKFAFLGIKTIRVLIATCYPIVFILTWITNKVLGMFKLARTSEELPFTEEEVETMLELGTKAGIIEPEQQEMLTGVLKLDEITVKEIMTPSRKVVSLNFDTPYNEVIEIVRQTNYSRYPVYKGEPGNIIGFIHVRDLLFWASSITRFHLHKILRMPLFVPDTKTVQNQLIDFRNKRIHMAFVVNEYGEVIGLVTLEDVLEEIVGEIEDEHDRWQKKIRELPDGSFLLDGSITLRDFKKYKKIEMPEADYLTIAGMILTWLGRVPKEGEEIVKDNIHVRVEKMDGNTISEVRLKFLDTSTQPA
ncbi:MAG: hemolysin [Deltaproteobacteria bacterium]|nr:MAG: hemolysin [Deltaproteobacteria bacterium]